MNNLLRTKILLTGGGTSGSVTPLLAIADELNSDKYEFLWLGTKKGPELKMVEKENIKFKKIVSVKLHRYISLYTLLYTALAPVLFLAGFIQSFFIILKFRPRWILTTGSFVSVPVVWAGFIFRKKILVHQQDARAGLANKLMAPLANVVTVTFEKSLDDYGKEAKWTGNPMRTKVLEAKSKNFFTLKSELPLIFIFGGGTGAEFLNKLVLDSLPELTKFCQIIHITGRSRASAMKKGFSNYFQYEFLDYDKMIEAYKRSSLVVARSGLATITELSYFEKPSIIIPMPNTHQTVNATLLETESAALILDQAVLNTDFFIKKIEDVLFDENLRKSYGKNIKKIIKRGAEKEIANIIKNF